MRDFFRENSNTIAIICSIVLILASFFVMIAGQFPIGLIMFFAGLLVFLCSVGKSLRSGGYHAEDMIGRGLRNHERRQSASSLKDQNAGNHTEVDSGIWGQMTGSDDKN